jgi:DNA-binding CsgD family transcriptional regulator
MRGPKSDYEGLERIVSMRAAGQTLAQIAAALGVTRQAVEPRLLGIPRCRRCKLTVELCGGTRGNICAPCYAAMMAERPSKKARRTGYRKSKLAHRWAAAVRLAREGKTIHEIADALDYQYQTVANKFTAMRKEGREIGKRIP